MNKYYRVPSTWILALLVMCGCVAQKPEPIEPPNVEAWCRAADLNEWDQRRVMINGVIFDNPCGEAA